MIYKKAFTLIELLVVISIITMLSSVTLSSLNSVRSKARDSKRIQDLVQIRNALELYYLDNGSYPVANITGAANNKITLSLNPPTYDRESWSYLENILKQYLYPLPVDPINKDVTIASSWKKGSYFYTYWALGVNNGTATGYSIFASLENPVSQDNYIDKTNTKCDLSNELCMYNKMNGGFGYYK